MAPAQVIRWIRQTYPKPVVNTEWLEACCAWISDEMQLNPNTQIDLFIAEVENQLLESDLQDSMNPGTGLPHIASTVNNQRIRGSPHILVEVTAITEVGHSAFNLHNVRQARIERADLAGLAQEEGAEDDEGPIPSYPRSMLRLELSDGSVTVPAIEYRSLPELKLEDTPLGFKILLKDVLVRRGILFLEPKGIVLKGHKNSDRNEHRDRDFLHGLFRRMMKPIPIRDQQDDGDDENQPPPGPPAQGGSTQPPVRPPLREVSHPPEPRNDGMDMDDDDADLPRKRRTPNRNLNSNPNPNLKTYLPPPVPSSVPSAPSNTLVTSRFFSEEPSFLATAESGTLRPRVLSSARNDPVDITDSSMEDPPVPSGPSSSSASRSITSVATARQATFSFAHNETGTTGSKKTSARQRERISYEEFEFDDDEYDYDVEMDSAFLDEVARAEQEAMAREVGKVSPAEVAAVTFKTEHAQVGSRMQPRLITKGGERRSNTPIIVGPSSSSSVTPTTVTATSAPTPNTSINVRSASIRKQPQSHPSTFSKPTSTTSGTNVLTQEVITIDDDEDEDEEYEQQQDDVGVGMEDGDDDDYDKENVPVLTRRVRRRVSTSLQARTRTQARRTVPAPSTTSSSSRTRSIPFPDDVIDISD